MKIGENMQAKISKFIAAVLALVIIFANSWSVVSYAAEVFLSEKELRESKHYIKRWKCRF